MRRPDYASRLGAFGESPRARRVAAVAPMEGAANLSTDGAMVLVRGEGWKEVKVTAISAVTVKPAEERAVDPAQPSRRDADPVVTLSQHSYQAGWWDADRMALFQYAEGLRQGIDDCPLADLWEGRTSEVIRALDSLSLNASRYSAEVQPAPDYFRSRESKMHYDRFRAEGYPIGSGTVESAAHTVVHDRMHRPGRGWKRDNAQAMLAGLSELHSDRFEHAWQTIPQTVN